MNRAEFADLDASLRLQYEGFAPGMYVRIELNGIPPELVEHFHPQDPLIVGGLSSGEQNVGCVQVFTQKFTRNWTCT